MIFLGSDEEYSVILAGSELQRPDVALSAQSLSRPTGGGEAMAEAAKKIEGSRNIETSR
jgi:hypothetical protein